MRHARLTIFPDIIRIFAIGIMLLGATAAVPPARAADPQPYTVTLKPTGNGALDAALQGSSTLISLREKAPVGGFAMVQRARDDKQRFETALHSFGYYKATVSLTIAGHPLDDPSLPMMI